MLPALFLSTGAVSHDYQRTVKAASRQRIRRSRTVMQPSRSKRPPRRPHRRGPPGPPCPRATLAFSSRGDVLGPLLFLLLLEAGLRLAGVGHPMSFFLPMQINGKDCLDRKRPFWLALFWPGNGARAVSLRHPQSQAARHDPRFCLRRVSRLWRSAAGIRPVPRFGGVAGRALSGQTF